MGNLLILYDGKTNVAKKNSTGKNEFAIIILPHYLKLIDPLISPSRKVKRLQKKLYITVANPGLEPGANEFIVENSWCSHFLEMTKNVKIQKMGVDMNFQKKSIKSAPIYLLLQKNTFWCILNHLRACFELFLLQ